LLVSRVATSAINEWYPKTHQINSELAVTTTGLIADGLVTVRKIRESRAKSVNQFIEETASWFWENTSQRGRRPLGVFLLVATTMGGVPRLLGFEPSGGCLSGWAIAVGRGSMRMQALLGSERPARNGKEAEALAQRAFGKPQKWEHDEVLHLKID
jgi:20S proteasome alpha/beta subunit